MTSKTLNIALQYSPSPAGRYQSDGPYPGETFRDELLWPALSDGGVVTVNLDGTAGFGSSFLEEAFGGLVRKGLTEPELQARLRIISARQSYVDRIWNYIHRAAVEEARA